VYSYVCLLSLTFFDLYYKIVFFFNTFGSLFVRKNLLHCETGFGVYRSTQLGHIPFFLLLYLLVGPSIGEDAVVHTECPKNSGLTTYYRIQDV
jgi:hypothetical protein